MWAGWLCGASALAGLLLRVHHTRMLPAVQDCMHPWDATSAPSECHHCAAVQGDGAVSRLLGGRHWLALGRVGGRWWNLDSSLEAPQLVASCCDGGSSGGSGAPAQPQAAAGTAAGDAAAVRRFLAQQVQQRDAKVFRVVDSALASHPLPSIDSGT